MDRFDRPASSARGAHHRASRKWRSLLAGLVAAAALAASAAPALAILPIRIPPSPPRNVSATLLSIIGGKAQLLIRWDKPKLTGTAFNLTYTAAALNPTYDNECGPDPGFTYCTVTGYDFGQPYTIEVIARTSDGSSMAKAKYTVPNVPGAPPNVKATVRSISGDNAVVRISWTAPSANGEPITSYAVAIQNGTLTCKSTGTFCDLTGLSVGGPYSVSVRATNYIGQGAGGTATFKVIPATPAPGAAATPTPAATESAAASESPAATASATPEATATPSAQPTAAAAPTSSGSGDSGGIVVVAIVCLLLGALIAGGGTALYVMLARRRTRSGTAA